MQALREEKLSPLFRLALKSGAPDAVALHLKRGEPANGRDGSGMTPLMIAAVNGKLEVCGALLQAGADRGRVNPAGKTASDLAREHGHELLGEFLFPVVETPSRPLPLEPASRDEVVDMSAFHADDDVDTVWQTEPDLSFPAVSPTRVNEVASASPVSSIGQPTTPSPSIAEIDASADPGVGDFDEIVVKLEMPVPPPEPDIPLEMHGWVIDSAAAVPLHDAACVQAAVEVQRSISVHRRANTDHDWSDIEFELPDAPSRTSVHARGDLEELSRVVAAGLKYGRVSRSEIEIAVDANGGHDDQRSRAILERILADLGIQFEDDSFLTTGDESHVESDELTESLSLLVADMIEPPSIADRYLLEARQLDLLDREGEERLGRRMDSALGALARALVSLPEPIWQQIFQSPLVSSAAFPDEGEVDSEDDEEVLPDDANEFESDPVVQPGIFRNYVIELRAGAAECGRDTAVPRPDPATLTFIESIAREVDTEAGREIASSVKAYFAARDQLVTANLRLVVSNAQVYRQSGLPLEDLIQNGNIGLLRAAERYDFRRGFKFSTFATWWIRQSISRGVMDTVRLIRIPVHVGEKMRLIERLRRENDRGHAPAMDAAEIAIRLSLSERVVKRLLRADIKIVSLEECGTAAEPGTPDPLTIPDPSTDPAQTASARSLSRLVTHLMADFAPRDRTVMEVRFGLCGGDSMTLEETGQRFNVTRERIRQIEAKALKKLRHPVRSDLLSPYEHSILLSEP